ncbi:PHD finger protein 11A-like [Meriones unguiculatus]|uniref:PHD finger protein 11A-like n=1 Tax=Meriones unguiculatus TaxID=10047 RepID=UPI00293EB55B|nr:PHD finger protein 11A-like [Meriones unguiculatus]
MEKRTCALCPEGHEWNVIYFAPSANIAAHENCLLYSSGLVECEDYDQRSTGRNFDVESVKKEIRRGRRLKCSLCKNRGATVGCDEASCAKKYHLLCGKEDKAVLQVDGAHGTYKLFCEQHAPEPEEPTQSVAVVRVPFLKKCKEAGLLNELFEGILGKIDSIHGRLIDERASESEYEEIEILLFDSGLFEDTLMKFQEVIRSKAYEHEERQRHLKQQLEVLGDLKQILCSLQENVDQDHLSSTSRSLEDNQFKCQESAEMQTGSADSL